MDIAIVGAGAIGGYYGARLAHGGHTVHFLARSTAAAMREAGLTVDSHLGDFSLPQPLVYSRAEDLPACDLVCVAVKATANKVVFPQLGGLVKPGGAIILLQNGFGAEQDLAALLPGVSILAGLCFISCFQDGPARVRHTGHGRLSLAPLTPGDPQAAAIAAVFAGCGVETETLPAAEAARLRKLVWNIPYNGLSVLADCLTDTLASAPPLLAAVQVIMEEVIEAAAACGVEIPRSFADEMKETIRNMPGSSPSMRLDWLNHRPLETEAIYGRVIAYAAAHGYDMKYARLLQAQLEYQESLYAG